MRRKTSESVAVVEGRPEKVVVPITLSRELEDKIIKASAAVKLSKQDTMRLSMERGIEILVKQLTGPVETPSA
jgi:tetrahydromethanopterin S-methyltransferase subunit A